MVKIAALYLRGSLEEGNKVKGLSARSPEEMHITVSNPYSFSKPNSAPEIGNQARKEGRI